MVVGSLSLLLAHHHCSLQRSQLFAVSKIYISHVTLRKIKKSSHGAAPPLQISGFRASFTIYFCSSTGVVNIVSISNKDKMFPTQVGVHLGTYCLDFDTNSYFTASIRCFAKQTGHTCSIVLSRQHSYFDRTKCLQPHLCSRGKDSSDFIIRCCFPYAEEADISLESLATSKLMLQTAPGRAGKVFTALVLEALPD